ncbi:MAG: DEAD/DEAH box helicase [Sphaerochaetaceae bacterium]|nr:DEAD/DEAH box helicase [Candidatus Cloacimonadota bacterium]
MKFEALPLHDDVKKGLQAARFVDCTLVQEKALPGALEGKDLMVQSKTGSGKTAVFLVAVLQKFIQERNSDATALIVAPTRELAVQISLDAKVLSSGIENYKIGCFYGGAGYKEQEEILKNNPHLIIATPGRILDFQRMGKIDFKKIDTFVIDEADRLFDMGFYPDIQQMFKLMGKNKKRQVMLFSATLGTRVRNLAWAYMDNPIEIEVQPEEITVENVVQSLYHVSKSEKLELLLRILAKENPTNALIFTNTKAMAIELSKRLNVNDYKSQYLMGDLPQSKRLAVINRMKKGQLRILVATDVAARGLQIDDLEMVINYDIPEDYESYVHRIGRTARAGKSGKAITLACEQFVYGLEAIEEYIQMKIPVLWIDDENLPIVVDKSANMRFRDLVSQKEYASSSFTKKSAPKKEKKHHRAPPRRPKPAIGVKKPLPKILPSKVNFNEVKELDFEQRMDYYKKMYAPQEVLSEQKERDEKTVAPKKKEGVLQKLFGRVKK